MNKQLLIIGGAALGFIVLDRITRLTNINEGTIYEGTGVIGAAGNIANQASGGFFAKIGSAIGDFLDPVNRKSLDELTGG